MLNFLESYRGKQITYEVSQEKLELLAQVEVSVLSQYNWPGTLGQK